MAISTYFSVIINTIIWNVLCVTYVQQWCNQNRKTVTQNTIKSQKQGYSCQMLGYCI